jgi:hypothetical protein
MGIGRISMAPPSVSSWSSSPRPRNESRRKKIRPAIFDSGDLSLGAAEGIPLKAFGNWRMQFKAEPQPPERKLLYRTPPLYA